MPYLTLRFILDKYKSRAHSVNITLLDGIRSPDVLNASADFSHAFNLHFAKLQQYRTAGGSLDDMAFNHSLIAMIPMGHTARESCMSHMLQHSDKAAPAEMVHALTRIIDAAHMTNAQSRAGTSPHDARRPRVRWGGWASSGPIGPGVSLR